MKEKVLITLIILLSLLLLTIVVKGEYILAYVESPAPKQPTQEYTSSWYQPPQPQEYPSNYTNTQEDIGSKFESLICVFDYKCDNKECIPSNTNKNADRQIKKKILHAEKKFESVYKSKYEHQQVSKLKQTIRSIEDAKRYYVRKDGNNLCILNLFTDLVEKIKALM